MGFLSYFIYYCYDCRKWKLGGSSERQFCSWLKTCSYINLTDYHYLRRKYSGHDWSSGQISLQVFSIHQVFGILHKTQFREERWWTLAQNHATAPATHSAHMKPPCEIRHLQDLTAAAAAVGSHSSHIRCDASGSIRLKAWRPLQRDPPVPSSICTRTTAVCSEKTAGGHTLTHSACLFIGSHPIKNDCNGNQQSLLCCKRDRDKLEREIDRKPREKVCEWQRQSPTER